MTSAEAPIPLDRLLAHREWVRGVARAMVRDENDADDLEQGLWLEALQRPPRTARSLRGWLATALRRDLTDRRRSEGSRARREASRARTEADASAESLVAEAEAHKRVVVAVMDLAEPYRSTVLLRWFEDLPPAAIAARQSVPLETVRTRIRRALALLRERFDAETGGDRSAWCLALVPLVSGAPAGASGASAVALGGLAMNTSAKVVLAVAAVLLAAAALWPLRDAPAPGGPVVAVSPDAKPAPRAPRQRATPDAPAETASGASTLPRADVPSAPDVAEAAAPAPDRPSAPPGTAVGRVLLLPDRTPIADAVIRVTGGFGGPDVATTVPRIPKSLTSGADGTFRIEGLTPGHYGFVVTVAGRAVPRTFDAVIPPDGSGVDVEVLFGVGGSVVGRVVSAIGPAAGIPVQLSRYHFRTECKTDAEGNYRIDDVPGGMYTVEAFAPTGTRASAAQVVVGGTARVDFTGGASLVGTLMSDGAPLANATVRVHGPGIAYRMQQTKSDERGGFRFDDVPEGDCRIEVQPPADRFSLVVAETKLVPGENRIEIRLGEGERSQEISGRAFALSSGAPLDTDWGGQIELYPFVEKTAGAPVLGTVMTALAFPDEKGEFRIPGLLAGRYQVRICASRFGPGRPRLEHAVVDIDLRPGERRTGLEIALRDAATLQVPESVAFLTGTVQDEAGRVLPGAFVRATAVAGAPIRQGLSNDSGQYQVDRLEPGTWRMEVQVIGESGFATEVAEAKVVKGLNRLDLRLGGGTRCELGGRLVARPSGRGLSWQEVNLCLLLLPADGPPRIVAFAQSAADGQFTFRSVPPGRLRLVAAPGGGSLRRREFDIELAPAAKRHDLDVALDEVPSGNVVLVVKDGQDQPVVRVTFSDTRSDGESLSWNLDSPTGVYERNLEAGRHALQISTRDGKLLDTATVDVRTNETTKVDVVLRAPKKP